MRVISADELRAQNGDFGTRLWVARAGKVYDVTDCPKWRSGMHEQMHYPALDLSSELPDAPHGPEVFERPCVKLVGWLATSADPELNEGASRRT